jgi:hypothetical protein
VDFPEDGALNARAQTDEGAHEEIVPCCDCVATRGRSRRARACGSPPVSSNVRAWNRVRPKPHR